ncbi:MAG: class I SAM-dependent methyltransferase [Endomicrobiaceae bacterium]|nr:class I SAM-dependent methyltransferase [Endomicrobiaceae bacterium]MDD4166464.1 class I SAM-dependent methyltransferase [Endomicrobiaceae bacterium]
MQNNVCPVCGCNDIKIQKTVKGRIFLCGCCSFRWAYCGLQTKSCGDYELLLKSVHALRIKNFNEIILRIKEKIHKKEIKGFEIGCAGGLFMELATAQNISMIGIEPMDSSVNEAKAKGLNIVKGFFPDDFKCSEKFDFIIFNDAFEHIPDINKIITECSLRLNKNGFVIINLPVSTGILFKTASFLSFFGIEKFLNRLWQFETDSPHVSYFNAKNLSFLMQKYGFTADCRVKQRVFVIQNLKDRIKAVNENIIFCNIIFVLLILLKPVIDFFPKDIECLFFKKMR